MFCNYCGSGNVNDAKFCNSCGKNISSEPVYSAQEVIKKPTLEDDEPITVDSNQSDIDKTSSKTTVSMLDTIKAKEQAILTSEESTDIVDILTNLVNFKDGKISRNTYVLSHIPIDKLNNAVKKYVPTELSGHLLILHDETALGSSKLGFILTTNYSHSYLSKEGSFKKLNHAIPLNEITSIELKPNVTIFSNEINIIVNNKEIGKFVQFDKKDIENICFILKQLIQNSNKLQNIPLDLFKRIVENKCVIEKETTPAKKDKFEEYNIVNEIKNTLTTKNIMIFLMSVPFKT